MPSFVLLNQNTTINQGLAPIPGAYEPRKKIWVQVGYPLYSAGGPSRLG